MNPPMLTVLIADDDPTCRQVLERALEKWGYQVVSSKDGTSALNIISTQPIDIAILDWFMPGFTGPEITEKHSKLESSRFVYKVILSGQMEKQHVIEALHRGAHDVMEKPCDLNVLQRRLATAAQILQEKRAVEDMALVMERYATQMETLANQRAQQLIHSERMSSLGVLAAGVAHEINNPMSFISGNVQNLQCFWKDLEPILRNVVAKDASPSSKKVEFVLEEMPKILESIMKGVYRVTKIVKGLKKYSGQQSKQEREPVNVNSCVEQALEMCRGTINKATHIELNLKKDISEILANTVEIEQILVNLIVNASHAMEGKENQTLVVTTDESQDSVVVTVDDTGSGIPQEIISKIWDPFMTTKPQGKGTGLGLSICSGIIRNLGGEISAENREHCGARIKFRIPTSKQGGQV